MGVPVSTRAPLNMSSTVHLVLLALSGVQAFNNAGLAIKAGVTSKLASRSRSRSSTSTSALMMKSSLPQGDEKQDRRSFLVRSSATFLFGGGFLSAQLPQPASAKVYLDPAMYGDQENRVSAVDSLRESVRRAILEKPALAPAFYELAILDGLSYDAATKEGGPDGRIIRAVLEDKSNNEHIADLKQAALTLIKSKESLKKLTAITISDAIALGGAEAVESVGGPLISVQLGRTDAPKTAKLSPLPLTLLSDSTSTSDVVSAFKRSGLTEREMTAILGGLLTLSSVKKTRDTRNWKASSKGKFRERGKIGRMSEFKRLTDEDVQEALNADDEEEEELLEGDEGWYIADSFGSRDEVYGQKVGSADLDPKSFNKYMKQLNTEGAKESFGWIGKLLLDKKNPTYQAWLSKYATTNLNFQKDLSIAFNAITQLGAEYTGGKYESLLKDKPRKTLNDF